MICQCQKLQTQQQLLIKCVERWALHTMFVDDWNYSLIWHANGYRADDMWKNCITLLMRYTWLVLVLDNLLLPPPFILFLYIYMKSNIWPLGGSRPTCKYNIDMLSLYKDFDFEEGSETKPKRAICLLSSENWPYSHGHFALMLYSRRERRGKES